MSVYYPTDCEDILPDHICDPCEDIEQGRVRSVAFIKKDFAFNDPSDAQEWQAGIEAGDIIIIPETKGTYDGGAEVLQPGYGDMIEKLTGYNHQLQYQDPNYKSNCNFYNLIKNSRQYKFAYRTGSRIHIIDETIQAIPKAPVQEDLATEVVYDVLIKWQSKNLPCHYEMPPGIFDRCFYVS